MPVTTRLATASPAPSSVASSQDVALSSTFDDTSTPTRRLTRSAARLLSPAAMPAPGTPKFAAPPSPPSGQRARSRSQSPATSVTGKSTPRAAARATRSASRLSVEVESTSASGGSRRGSIPPTTPAAADKGKAREVVVEEVESEDEDDSSEASSSSSSESESESEEDSDDDEGLDKFAPARTEAEEEAFLAGLLSQAYASAEAKAAEKKAAAGGGVLLEMESTKEVPLPGLDVPNLPSPYLNFDKSGRAKLTSSSTRSAPAAAPSSSTEPAAEAGPSSRSPPELDTFVLPPQLSKKAAKAARAENAPLPWSALPPIPSDRRKDMTREYHALKLRNSLDPKRFYKGQGSIQHVPEVFAIGRLHEPSKVMGSTTLIKEQRVGSIIKDLVVDSEATEYAKRKFGALQEGRERNGRGKGWKKRKTKF